MVFNRLPPVIPGVDIPRGFEEVPALADEFAFSTASTEGSRLDSRREASWLGDELVAESLGVENGGMIF